VSKLPVIGFFDFYIGDFFSEKSLKGGGGASVQIKSWIEGVIARRGLVEIITLDWQKNKIDGIKAYTLWSVNNPIICWITRIVSLHNIINKLKSKVIYQAGAGPVTIILLIMVKLHKRKMVHRIANDVDTDARIKNKLPFLQRSLYRLGLRYADIVLCQNMYQYNRIVKMVKTKKVYIFHNPITLSQQALCNNKRTYVAWIGLFQKQKDLKTLCTIIEQNDYIQFKIGGYVIPKTDEETKRYLKRIENCTNAELVGGLRRDEIAPFLQKADCLLNTSLYEGFSNTFLEAMAVGTPVICPRNVDPDGIIYTNKIGWSIERESFVETCAKVLSLDKSALREKCFSYVKNNHSSEILAGKLLQVLYE